MNRLEDLKTVSELTNVHEKEQPFVRDTFKIIMLKKVSSTLSTLHLNQSGWPINIDVWYRPALQYQLKWVPKEVHLLKKFSLNGQVLISSPGFIFPKSVKLTLKPQNHILELLNLNLIPLCMLPHPFINRIFTFPCTSRTIVVLFPTDCQAEIGRHVSDAFRKWCWIRFWDGGTRCCCDRWFPFRCWARWFTSALRRFQHSLTGY